MRNNGEHAKQILDSYKQELKVIEAECVNDTVFKEEKSKARQLLKAGLITLHHYQNILIKKLNSEHKKYIDKLQEIRNKHDQALAEKLGHSSTYSCEDLENLISYYNKDN